MLHRRVVHFREPTRSFTACGRFYRRAAVTSTRAEVECERCREALARNAETTRPLVRRAKESAA